MKRIVVLLCLFALAIGFAHAQTGHSVQLKWTASADSTTTNPGTVTVYRASAACPASGIGTLSYTALTAAAAPAGPYTDSAVTPGTFCYYITFSVGGATSPASNTAQAVILPLAPSVLTVAISQ